jgi:hypothetical protein
MNDFNMDQFSQFVTHEDPKIDQLTDIDKRIECSQESLLLTQADPISSKISCTQESIDFGITENEIEFENEMKTNVISVIIFLTF